MKKINVLRIAPLISAILLATGVSVFPGTVSAREITPQTKEARISTWANISFSTMTGISLLSGQWECWDDGSLEPCHSNLNDVDDGWAVGDNGLILVWDGSNWSKINSPTHNSLFGVDATPSNGVWIVGENGLILHGDGPTTLAPVTCDSVGFIDFETLYDVQVENNIVWIAGGVYDQAGQIVRLPGAGGFPCSAVTTSAQPYLDLSIVPGTDGKWIRAVGSCNGILHFGGEFLDIYWEWGEVDTCNINAIAMASATEGWVAGFGVVMHMTGCTLDCLWLEVTGPYNSFASMWALDAMASNNVWMTGFDNGFSVIYNWDGTEWSISYGNIGSDYLGIKGNWAVGEGTEIVRWNGSEWTQINHAYNDSITKIAMINSTRGWAASSGWPVRYADILAWDGADWSIFGSMDAMALDIVPGTNGADAWAGGVWGGFFRWNGSSWNNVSIPTELMISDIKMISSNSGWVVAGDEWNPGFGNALLYWNGIAWLAYDIAPITEEPLLGIDLSSAASGWAVGSSGTLLRWNGTSWALNSIPYSNTLYAVDILSANSGWIVGSGGLILHWNGSSWSTQSSPITNDLHSVKMLSDTDGWIVGSNGAILRWDGINWSEVDSPVKTSLGTVTATATDIWAGGDNGVILRYNLPNSEPGAFAKLAPSDASLAPVNTTISWEASNRADYYVYCVDTIDNGVCDTSWVFNGASTDAMLNGLDNNDTYYWFVAATNASGTTYADNGTWWSFTTPTFADVPISHWAWSYIERLYAAGITGGCATSPLRFCPNTSVTRAEMPIFLERGMRGSSYTPPPATGTVFSDVPISYWSAAWIEKLYADGITGGCGGGKYCPSQAVTRAEMAIFLLRAEHGAGYTPPAATGTVFADIPISYWAAAWIEQLNTEGITGGCGGGNYCPGQAVTRAEMAIFLVRTFGLP